MSKILGKNDTGFGMLIEKDAGYIDINEEFNSSLLNEGTINIDPSKPILINCILQKYGVQNKNGRIYPEKVLRAQVEEFQRLIEINSAMSEADHPESSTVSLLNVSHLIKKMWWGEGENKNVLYGQLEIITSQSYMNEGKGWMVGDKIAEYLRRGVRLGISSRGVGSLKEEVGQKIVQDDFELICFDLVASPSTPGAYLFPEKNEMEIAEKVVNNKNNINENKIVKALDRFLL
jgi:hypothetical protein